MIKHFEHLWEDAEKAIWAAYQEEGNIYVIDAVKEVQQSVKELAAEDSSKADQERAMGRLLLHVCLLSKQHDINTYAVLKEAMDDLKVEMLDPDIELDV